MAGLDSTGLTILSESEIRTELQDSYRTIYGNSINVTPESKVGAQIEVFTKRESLIWQLAQNLYDNTYVNSAQGIPLDDLGLLVGQARDRARASTVTLTVGLDALTTLPGGSQARVPNTQIVFATDADVTNGTGSPALVTVAATATVTGPLVAGASTITEIVNPVTGWTSVTNVAAAVAGADEQVDADYRSDIIASATAQSGSTDDAIRAAVLAVAGVTAATVTSNRTDAVVSGIDPHTFETVVLGGAGTDIANAILANYPAGIGTTGTTTVQVTDSQGVTQDINYTPATALQVYVDITYEVETGVTPGDTVVPVQNAISTFSAGLTIGEVLHASALYPTVFAVGGIDRITALTVGTAPSPVGFEVIPSSSQVISIASGDVTVTAT